jgi:hypothetical protein
MMKDMMKAARIGIPAFSSAILIYQLRPFHPDKRGATYHGHKIGANNRVFCLTHPAKRGAEAIAKALSRSVAFRGGCQIKQMP